LFFLKKSICGSREQCMRPTKKRLDADVGRIVQMFTQSNLSNRCGWGGLD